MEVNNITYVKGDVFDVSHLTKVLRDCNSVIHMAGLPDARIAQEQPQISFDLNIRSLQVLLEAMRNNNTLKVILPTSAAIYGVVDKLPVKEDRMPKPTNIYGFHKYIAERLAESYSINYGIKVTILRLFNVYGIKGKGILNILTEKATKRESVKLYGEKQKRDFIHMEDIARANIQAAKSEVSAGKTFNIGTGKPTSVKELFGTMKELFGSDLEPMYEEGAPEEYPFVADISKPEKLLGYLPTIELREGLERLVDDSKDKEHFLTYNKKQES